MLDDRMLKAIDMLLDGSYTHTQIAKAVGLKDRTTIWSWKRKNKEFIAELNRRTEETQEFLKNSTQKKFDAKVDNVLAKLEYIINNSKNDNTVKDACIYWIERVVGKMPTKIEAKVENIVDDVDVTEIDDFENWDSENKEE